jgi:hypothetical protein
LFYLLIFFLVGLNFRVVDDKLEYNFQMVFSFILVFKNFLNFKYELSSLELQFLAKKLFLINLHYLGVLTNLNQFKK